MTTTRTLLLLLACTVTGLLHAQPTGSFVAEFDPTNGTLPYPSNLLFSGSTDGTLNIPIADPGDPASATVRALNQLDGFSTVAPLVATFSAAIDPASVQAGVSVRLYKVGLVNPFLEPGADTPFEVTGIEAELVGGEDFSAGLLAEDPEQRTLAITPLKPLEPKTGYMVVLTDGIRAVDDRPALPDLGYIFARYRKPLIDDAGHSRFRRLDDAQAQALEPLRRQVVSQEDAASDRGLRRGEIVLSWTFLTQSIDDVLQRVAADLEPQPLSLAPSGLDTGALGLGGLADIYSGSLQIPYYLEAPTLIPTVILTGQWTGANDTPLTRYNPQPVVRQKLTIPVLVTIPNAASGQSRPANGWPTVVYQHGLGQNRTNMLAVADALAATGLAAIAIDAPLHGVTDTDSPFYRPGLERTFNVDLIDNDTGAPGADGAIDPSGTHFINLNSLLTGRDNLRQGAADLLALIADLGNADLDGDDTGDLDDTQIGFVGHSLGGIIGGVMLGVDDGRIGPASLAMAGGGIARTLEGSGFFGPRVRAGLEAAGILPGTLQYAEFLRIAQQIIDAGDPLNYAALAAGQHPVQLLEVLDDDTIPNSVPGAPLSGTEPLAAALGLAATGTSTFSADGLRVMVRFLEGQHASLVSGQPLAVTAEMQRQIAGFMASGGTLLEIDDTALIQQP